MWELILWIAVFLSLTHGHVFVVDNEVRVSTLNPNLATDVTEPFKEEPVTGEDGADGASKDEENVVVTKYGPVRGYQMSESRIWKFLDIPYAAFDSKQPFQEPTEPESWETVREITEHNSRCPQLAPDDSYIGSPDCLTLSIFVPERANNTSVLCHIHDGGFIQGSGDPGIYGPGYLVPKDVILILPNYRLGPLGFLSLQNKTAPGNAALRDLTMALNWTRENIEAFGGNPLSIAVSGEGSGAVLAQYLSLASKSQNYVSKVITESGCVLSHWAIDRNPVETANRLLRMLNYSEARTTGDSVFNNISLQAIITAAKGFVFRPCVEREGYLTNTPWNLLHELKLNKSFMIGSTDRPGMHKAMKHTEESISALNEDFRLLLPDDLAFEQRQEEKETGRKVKIQYFGNNTITLNHQDELSLCHSDCSFLSPGIRNARLLAKAACTVYLYEFSYVDNTGDHGTHRTHGAAGGDSLKYVFQRQGRVPVENTEEYRIINLMTNLWVSFIQTGKPTSDEVEWEEFEETNVTAEAWLSVASKTEMKRGFHPDRLSLWTDIYNEHFIENNTADRVKPLTFGVCVIVMGFVKNLYH